MMSSTKESAPVRVVAVLPTINTYGGVLSVVNMLDEFLELGHEVRLCSLSKYSSSHFNLRYEPIYIDAALQDGRFLDGTPIDFVIATSWDTVDIVLRICDDTGGTPIYFVQDIESDFVKDDPVKYQMAVESYGRIKTKIVKTDYLRERLIEMGHDAHVIVPGMNLNIFYPRARVDDGRLRVLALARPKAPHGQRGFDILVEAFRHLKSTDETIDVGFFGADELTEAELGFAFVNFGRLSSNKLANAYAWANIYVDASRFHGFGRTGVEAMACGAVAVLSDSGGVRHYARDGENALIVPVGSVDAIIDAVERLRDNPDLRLKLSSNGLKTTKAFDDRIAAQQFLQICLQEIEQ